MMLIIWTSLGCASASNYMKFIDTNACMKWWYALILVHSTCESSIIHDLGTNECETTLKHVHYPRHKQSTQHVLRNNCF